MNEEMIMFKFFKIFGIEKYHNDACQTVTVPFITVLQELSSDLKLKGKLIIKQKCVNVT